MIVITGFGRSGTSFVANACKELGYPPGECTWRESIDAGMEDK